MRLFFSKTKASWEWTSDRRFKALLLLLLLFLTLGRYDPEGILKTTDNTKIDTNNQPVQSMAGKLSWSNIALKCCTSTEHLWNRKFVSLTSPLCSEIFLPRSHRSWRADVLSMPSVSMAISSKIYRPSRSVDFSSLWGAAISAAAPDSRAAATMSQPVGMLLWHPSALTFACHLIWTNPRAL